MSKPAKALEACFESASPKWREFLSRFAKTPQRVAYYPSAGRDLRPLLYWKAEGLKDRGIEPPAEYNEPDLWLFSDYFPDAAANFFDTRTLHFDDRTWIRILDFCEIRPVPGEFEFRVNRDYTDLSSSHATGKAVWFRAQVASDRMESYEVDAIYFFYENVNLISQLFMRHKVPVTHLAWKRDGGSGNGGGKLVHGFLRSLPAAMQTQWFIFWNDYLDDCLLEKEWPEELEQWRDRYGTPLNLEQLGKFAWDSCDNVAFLKVIEEEH